jgi:hypothetical protein
MRATRFTLQVTIGNEAMLTGDDLADLLRKLANRVSGDMPRPDGTRWPVRDANGNRVGTWEIEGEGSDDDGSES